MLDRFRPTLRMGEGSAPYHWLLDEVGARIVAAELGRDRDQIRWRRSDPLKVARTSTLDHRIAVNEFFVRLAVEARAAGGALREWYGERTTQRLLDGIAAPDGYGVLVFPDCDPLHLLLELDRGTEPLRRIREKVDRYAKALPRSELADADLLVLAAAGTASCASRSRACAPRSTLGASRHRRRGEQRRDRARSATRATWSFCRCPSDDVCQQDARGSARFPEDRSHAADCHGNDRVLRVEGRAHRQLAASRPLPRPAVPARPRNEPQRMEPGESPDRAR